MARSVSQDVWLAQVPSPAQAAKVDWYVPWFVKDPLVGQFALCTAACSDSALNDFSESTQIGLMRVAIP